MVVFTPSLLPNPFKEGTASYTIAERLKAKPQWPFRELVAGLDILDPYRLLQGHMKAAYAKRHQVLKVRRGLVVLQ